VVKMMLRRGSVKKVCMMCGVVMEGGEDKGCVSHGVCSSCLPSYRESVRKEIEEYKRRVKDEDQESSETRDGSTC